MRWLRSTRRLRLLVALLATSLLPFVIVVPEQQVPRATQAQADWLRDQVRTVPDAQTQAAFEQALEVAMSSGARSLDGFLEAFADAYKQQAPEQALADLFDAPNLSGKRLLQYLQHRLAHVSGRAALPRLLSFIQAASVTSLDRTVVASTVVSTSWNRMLTTVGATIQQEVWTYVLPLRILFTARPMGP